MENFSYIVLGSFLTIIGTLIKIYFDRKANISNKLFDLRLKALNDIWEAFIQTKPIFYARILEGHSNWCQSKDNVTKACNILKNFRDILEKKSNITSQKYY